MMVLVQVQERALCAVSNNTEGTCGRLGDNRHVRKLRKRRRLKLELKPKATVEAKGKAKAEL